MGDQTYRPTLKIIIAISKSASTTRLLLCAVKAAAVRMLAAVARSGQTHPWEGHSIKKKNI